MKNLSKTCIMRTMYQLKASVKPL